MGIPLLREDDAVLKMGLIKSVKSFTWVALVLHVSLVWASEQSWYIDIHTQITNTSNDGRHVTVEFYGRTSMTATWSQQIAMPTRNALPQQTWFLPITGSHDFPINAASTMTVDGRHQEITQLELDHDEWSDEQLALSYISEEGNIYYYRRIPAFDPTIWASHSQALDWRMVDRIGSHFPPSVPFEEGDDVILSFDVYVNTSLQTYAACVLVTYDVIGDCRSSCSANVTTRYIYSDWEQDTLVNDTHIVVTKTTNETGRIDDSSPMLAWYPTHVRLIVTITNAVRSHSGQYVCNLYTEPFEHGASFHTQTKLLFHNSTSMWRYGFIAAEMNVCGTISPIIPLDDSTAQTNVTILAGLDNCLLCYGKGNPSPNITFSKDGDMLDLTPDNYLVEPEDDGDFQAATYILRDVTVEDAGEYTCHATNGITQGTYTISVAVKLP